MKHSEMVAKLTRDLQLRQVEWNAATVNPTLGIFLTQLERDQVVAALMTLIQVLRHREAAGRN